MNIFGKRIHFRWFILAALLIFIWLVMLIPGAGEWYARHLYKYISFLLSCLSTVFPFSLTDCFIYGSIVGLIIYLVYSIIRRRHVRRSLCRALEYLVWVYAWFYLAWGLNYFRDNFYERNQITKIAYSQEEFKAFLSDYTELLNESYVPVEEIDHDIVSSEVKRGYRVIADRFGLLPPMEFIRVKPMMFSSLMSSVGVLGYIGPFFTEAHVNSDLLPVQYPSTYAHELGHVLNVANEAEANLYSFLVCSRSEVAEIRFAGYFSLFPYVLGNVYRLLGKEEYEKWLVTLRPELKELYNDKQAYWRGLYSPVIGDIQDKAYNLFLKGNKIPSGTDNYSEVIALLLALNKEQGNTLR